MYLEDLSREDVISLGYKYLNGDEENGIFIDYDKAKFCFDFVNWNEDTMEKINPDCDLLIADYYLNGNSITIKKKRYKWCEIKDRKFRRIDNSTRTLLII